MWGPVLGHTESLKLPPSPSHRTTIECLLPVETDYPILLGTLKPSLCCLRSGLGVPPEETQDEQGEQQCGKGQGVAHGVHNLQPLQAQPLVLGVGQEDTEIELSSSPRAIKVLERYLLFVPTPHPSVLLGIHLPLSEWGTPPLNSKAGHVTSQSKHSI